MRNNPLFNDPDYAKSLMVTIEELINEAISKVVDGKSSLPRVRGMIDTISRLQLQGRDVRDHEEYRRLTNIFDFTPLDDDPVAVKVELDVADDITDEQVAL